MSNYVNKNTDFDNVTITNDYPCLTGIWYLKYDSYTGNTYYYDSDTSTTPYTVNGEPYTGPVNFVGSFVSVNIMKNATADGIVVVSKGTSGSGIVNNYGTLTNSTIFNATVNNGLTNSLTLSPQTGISTGNSYVSCTVNMKKGVVSTDDTIYNIPQTASTSGNLNLSQLSSVPSASDSFQTSNGNGTMVVGTTSSISNNQNNNSQNITINNPTIINNSDTASSSSLFGKGSFFGNIDAKKPLNSRVSNSNQTFVAVTAYAGTPGSYQYWTAYLGDDGVTTYYKTTDAAGNDFVTTGPLNLLNIQRLTIESGATVDNCLIAQTVNNYLASTIDATGPSIIIKQGGTLKNSIVNMATIDNSGTSYNNAYLQATYTGNSGSISDLDGMYQYLGGYVGTLTIPKATNKPSWKVDGMSLGNNPPTSSITLNDGSVFNSYASVVNSASSAYPYPSITINQSGNVSIVSSDTVTCFLVGTMINTINGLVAVENLRIGDKVVTYQNNRQDVQPIIWIGYNHVKVKTYLPEDVAGYPVRIVKNAISEGVPASDLLITPEHSIFFEGGLIPARMLVNNSSIFYDHSITEYTFYHFELEAHSIVAADNVLTESYLDTGNRSSFISDHNIVNIVNKKKDWNVDAVAPLVTNRAFVEPIFMQLIERAIQLGFENHKQDLLTTNDSGLHLLTQSGERLEATYQNNGRFIFSLPEGTNEVRLMSRTSKASRVIGPFVDDRRDLGVLVGEITLLEKNSHTSITEHLTSAELSGWDVKEQTACRWTNGNAELKVRATPAQNTGVLVIQVLATLSYVVENAQKVA
ncbi:Hint domain-containing protein [Commensalibacter intestini]|uniref:Hint domain-containing protein n=1 Tax=Commensalibacter intestini TaxID=479936 RepID=UPI000A3654F3|nr:Hint domain-containing protein [Commensalibacter intestini]